MSQRTPLPPDMAGAAEIDPRLATQEPQEFDLLLDVLLPLALFAMLGSLVWFLIDVRAALTDGPTRLLRWVFFFFMVGVVGIARIKAREGHFNAAPYAGGLLLAMALLGYFFAYGGGSLGGGYGGSNPTSALVMNYLIIALIWFGGNFIVTQTTLDPTAVEVQPAGLLSSEEWEARGERSEAVRRRPHPGRAVMAMSILAVALFGAGHRLLANHPDYQRHAFACMVVYLASALAVLAMTALNGLQVYARQRGTRVPAGVVGLWLALALPIGAAVLLVAQVAPRLQPRPDSFAPQLPPVIERMVTRWRDAPAEGLRETADPAGRHRGEGQGEAAGTSSAPTPGRGAQPGEAGSGGTQAEQSRAEPGGKGRESGGEGEGAGRGEGRAEDQGANRAEPAGGEGQEAAGQKADPQGEGQAQGGAEEPSSAGQQGSPQPEQGQTEAAAEDESQGDGESETKRESAQGRTSDEAAQTRPPPAPVVPEPPADLGRILLSAIFALVALGVLWLVGRAARGWLGRLGAWWRGRPRRSAAADAPAGPTRDPFVDPFGPRSPLRGRPPAEVVRHVYRAFQAYAAMAGCARRPDLTAHEFLAELPPSMDSWKDSIRSLTNLYEAAEYTPGSVDESCVDELRAFWQRLMQAVNEVRR